VRRFFFTIVFFLLFLSANAVYAQPQREARALRAVDALTESPSVILVEQTTGRVLYARNERERRYPANLTNMLTALVAIEHLAPTDEVIIGSEIRGTPAGFGVNVHSEGEIITVHTLLNSLLVRSSGEAARVLALNTMRQTDGRRNIPYEEAERAFVVLMNEKARSFGTQGSHFASPLGAHSENHFTTAYDLAIITRAFMNNPILAEIAGTREYNDWTNSNQMLPHAPFGYAYMTGAKAGFTSSAGHVLAGAAYDAHLGLGFVTIVLGGTDPERWQDTRRLMDHGFNNFRFREIAREGEILKTVQIENPRLGDPDTLDIIASESHTALLGRFEYYEISQIITLNDEQAALRAPIEYGERIGTVSYVLNNEVLFESGIYSQYDVIPRTFDSDMDYYLAAFAENVFTRRALPYWFGIFGVAFGVFGIVIAVKAHIRVSRKAVRTLGKSRYSRY